MAHTNQEKLELLEKARKVLGELIGNNILESENKTYFKFVLQAQGNIQTAILNLKNDIKKEIKK